MRGGQRYGLLSPAWEAWTIEDFFLLLLIVPPGVFLFFVTGKFGPIRLPDTWAKHCESCGKEWSVLHRTRCPRCGITLGKSNLFASAKDWRLGKEADRDDPLVAEALRLAAEHRKALRRRST